MLRRTLALCLVCFAVACGEDPQPKPEFKLDVVDPALDSGSFRFGDTDDAGRAADSGGSELPDASPSQDALSDADAAADGGVSADVDAGPPPAPITSCEGHCGIFLEGNACHCHHGCVDEGNCCEGFEAACACRADGDCDDANDCTSDSCDDGFCKQIPLPKGSCCSADSECKGGDSCTKPKCLTGTCTLEKKDCDDKVACTTDACDAKTGACVNLLAAGKCLIADECVAAGDADPVSNGCGTCQPTKNAKAWTPLPGKCLIAGACVDDKTVAEGGTCAVCTVAKSTTAWTVASGQCFIAGKCYAKGATNPENPSCEVCDPTSSTSAWSGAAGKCAIEGTCHAAGTANPAASCQTCDPSKSKSAWSLKAGTCLVDGTCYASGKGTSPCVTCDVTKSTAALTPKKATAVCDDGDPCTSGTTCDAAGECLGKAVVGCCKIEGDCAQPDPGTQPCEIGFCNVTTGTCGFKKDPACCSSGQCCDLATKTVKEKGTPCGIKNGVEYQCSENLVEEREVFYGCNGTSATTCSSAIKGYGPWKLKKTCNETETCTPAASTTTTPTCKPN